MKAYIVATIKSWNIEQFRKKISKYPGKWVLISDPKQLTAARVRKINPRYIFFPHWSWVVPKEILNAAECVCFHETDVPYGRGGSPIQNLIVRGHTTTKITALRMEEGMDTGPVYLKVPISLKGSAQEIFVRNASVVAEMIRRIAKAEPTPKAQSGEPTVFKRRTPEESDLRTVAGESAEKVYDFIRMLDAETYPHAFVEVGDYRVEFTKAKKGKNSVATEAIITKKV